MFKKSIRFLALLIAVLFVLSCFAGCGKSKGVYNAASKYIKEKSEAITPSDTESGKENGDSSDTPAVSDKTDTSDTASVADTSSKVNSSSKADTSSNQDVSQTLHLAILKAGSFYPSTRTRYLMTALSMSLQKITAERAS